MLDNKIKKNEFPKLKLLAVGRIHPQKNFLELIKAIKIINNKNISLDIIGAPQDREYFKLCNNFLSKNNLSNINLLGSKDKEQVIKRYSEDDVFCMPSIVEGVSMALIEAASFWLPSIVTNGVGNYFEILEDNAGLITSKYSNDIANTILKIYKNENLLNLLKSNAYHSSIRRYNINLIGEKLMQEYKKII